MTKNSKYLLAAGAAVLGATIIVPLAIGAFGKRMAELEVAKIASMDGCDCMGYDALQDPRSDVPIEGYGMEYDEHSGLPIGDIDALPQDQNFVDALQRYERVGTR